MDDSDARNLTEALRPQDTSLLARRQLGAMEIERAAALTTSQTLTESQLYEALVVLRDTAP